MNYVLDNFDDPWDALDLFESNLAEYSGSKYAVCVDSASNAIFLCLKYLNITGQTIELPKNTYASVPMQCIHAGNKIAFKDIEWKGVYSLGDTRIVDGATRFKKDMYIKDSYQCLSFHHRKTLKLGRGGAILTNDKNFVDWCRPMIFDGRNRNTLYKDDEFSCIGYHMYMTPETALHGLNLLEQMPNINPDTGDSDSYPDLSKQSVFRDHV
jgi:dTDP-4-amino-4,6-dideoxygalactose transaminase